MHLNKPHRVQETKSKLEPYRSWQDDGDKPVAPTQRISEVPSSLMLSTPWMLNSALGRIAV